MNKLEGEKKQITIHWWNFQTKTLDFKGTVKDYLLKRSITVRKIKHPRDKTVGGYRFKIPLSSSSTTLDIFDSDYISCINEVIKTFLSQLGDKTLYYSPYGRSYKINWW